MLNKLRERVAHSSPALRSFVGVAAQWLPVSVRYGKDFVRTLADISQSESSEAWASQTQKEQLRTVLRLAGQTAALRNDERYASLRMSIHDPELVLASLPVLHKEDFREAPETFLTMSESAVDKVTTSGSSGEPAVFYLDKQRAASEWAYMCHAWSASGYRPGDWRAMVRGAHLGGHPPRRWLVSRATNELMLSAMGLDEAMAADFWRLISKKRIRYIHGYPSALSSLATAALKNGGTHMNQIKGIFPVSEGMLSHQVDLLATAFPNASVLPSYGLSERVAMAKYNLSDGCYHFYPLSGYVEVLDGNDRPVCVGERGRIVATGLRLQAMPLIRYDTGDTAELVEVGRSGSPVVKEILGRRAQEGLVTKNGGIISAAALNLHSEIYARIFVFRIRQFKAGQAEVLAVPVAGAGPDTVARFARELEQNTLGEIQFTGIRVDALAPTPNGKLRLIDQHMTIDEDSIS